MKFSVRQNVLPFFAALIWGFAFVAQSIAADSVPPLAFNAARCFVGTIVLFLLIIVIKKASSSDTDDSEFKITPELIKGGVACGTALAAASAIQQYCLAFVSVGKAGFLTALYIVLVPIFGVFLGKKVRGVLWISVLLATFGLYFLCVKEEFKIEPIDAIMLLCSAVFAFHILLIDKYSARVNGVCLSCAQFVVAFIICSVLSFFTEDFVIGDLKNCIVPLLYMGILSSGVAYTLQIVAQRGTDPTVVSLILSLESVISVVAGAIILHERLMPKEYIGCIFMMGAVILAQLPERKKKAKE